MSWQRGGKEKLISFWHLFGGELVFRNPFASGGRCRWVLLLSRASHLGDPSSANGAAGGTCPAASPGPQRKQSHRLPLCRGRIPATGRCGCQRPRQGQQ